MAWSVYNFVGTSVSLQEAFRILFLYLHMDSRFQGNSKVIGVFSYFFFAWFEVGMMSSSALGSKWLAMPLRSPQPRNEGIAIIWGRWPQEAIPGYHPWRTVWQHASLVASTIALALWQPHVKMKILEPSVWYRKFICMWFNIPWFCGLTRMAWGCVVSYILL